MTITSGIPERVLAESVADQAADWYARLSSERATEGDWQRFWAWRDRDNAHAAAYDRVSVQWTAMQVFADEPEIVALRLQALAEEPVRQSRHWMAAMAATILAVLFTSAVFLWPQWNAGTDNQQIAALPGAPNPAAAPTSNAPAATALPSPASGLAFRSQFQTGTGERSQFTLPDGSVLELNTDSQVNVDFAIGMRNLKLARGEAVFHVAHDKSRPFIVSVGTNRVIALGTVFSVRHDPGESIVTLLEGKVRIERLSGGVATEAAQLVPGEQLTTKAAEPFSIRKADFRQVASWRDGRLIFNNEPLGDVVKEINRYSRRKLFIASDDLTDIRVSGTFRLESSDQFAKALEIGFPISADRDDATGRIVLTPKRVTEKLPPATREQAPDSVKKN